MMRVGLDLVEVEEVRCALARFGERYRRRVFTDEEIRRSEASSDPVGCLAQFFAAKEATLKLLRASDEGVDWRTIDCGRQGPGLTGDAAGGTNGALRLSAHAYRLALDAGISGISLSLSRSGDHAMAVAVAWGPPAGPPGKEGS